MSDTAIVRVRGRRVWDSRARPTVEAEVELACGARGRAIAPSGASRGRAEAVELRDAGPHLDGLGVERAVANVNGEIARHLVSFDARDQDAVDRALIELDGTPNKSRLGGNAIVAVSLAVAHAAAAAAGLPLWRRLAGDRAVRLPLPQIQVFGGGAHAARRVDVQDFMVMPLAAQSFDEALCVAAEVRAAAGRALEASGDLAGVADEGGWWPAFDSNEQALDALVRAIEVGGFVPGDEVAIALDVAASQLAHEGGYRLARDARTFALDAWIERLCNWCERYPIASLEDPVAEDDTEGMRRVTAALGANVQVVGDDFLVTNAERVLRAARDRACTALLVKPNQAGTLTEAYAALEAARANGLAPIVSARSGESEDVSVVHLAVGWDAGQLKVGSIARSERTAKWNEALRIEEHLGESARFAGRAALGTLD